MAVRLIRYLVPLLFLSSAALAEHGTCHAIDGDTILCKGERIRLENVDTPELHGKCEREIDAARAAKLFAQSALDGAINIEIRVFRPRPKDRYGRTLATVIIDGDDLGQLIIQAGLGRSYHGERRKEWCDK